MAGVFGGLMLKRKGGVAGVGVWGAGGVWLACFVS